MQRSWSRQTTKGGEGRVVPVCAECVPYLKASLASSPSEYVFPRMSGKHRGEMLNPDTLDPPASSGGPSRLRGSLRVGATSAERG